MDKAEPSGIAAAYDQWSQRYDSQANATRDLDEQVLRSIVPDLEGRTVVECGCGTGKNSLWLAPRCARLVGIDFSLGMLGHAIEKVRFPNVLFLQADLLVPWPLASGVADVVLFNLVLEHVKDLVPVFAEAARVLRQGGRMALSEYHPSRVLEGKGPVVLDDDGTVSRQIPNYLHTLDDYSASARQAGLQLLAVNEWSETQLKDGLLVETKGGETKPQLVSMVFGKA